MVAGLREPSRWTCSSALGQRRSASFEMVGTRRAVTTTRNTPPASPTGSRASTRRPTPSVTYADAVAALDRGHGVAHGSAPGHVDGSLVHEHAQPRHGAPKIAKRASAALP